MESISERPPWLRPQNLSQRVNKMEQEQVEPVGGKRNAWMTHLKKTMRANKGKSLSQVMKMAKKTYKKSAKRGGSALSPATVGGRRHRTRRATRRSLY